MGYTKSSGEPAFVPLMDAALVAIAGWLAYYARWGSWEMPFGYFSVLVLGTGLVLIILPLTGAYRSWRGESHWQYTGNALPGLIAVTALLMAVGTLTKTTAEYSRLWMGYWFILSTAALFCCRWVCGRVASHLLERRRPRIRVLLVGDGPFAASVAARARAAEDADWQIVGLVSPDPALSADASPDIPAIPMADMKTMVTASQAPIDEVWIAMEHSDAGQKKNIMDLLQGSCLTVRYIPDLSVMELLNHVPSRVAGMTMIDLNASPLDGHAALIKAAADKLIALTALVVLAPLIALIALLVKLDSTGPVFFRQPRLGWDGRVIKVLKFRTMHDTAADDGQAKRQDPRVTRVGRLLRRSSLDELPQFINVLRGDMSVVGPRPHPLALNRDYVQRIDAYMQRHRVKPGITGWAQVHGLRGETETLHKMQRRVEYDLYYIEHWSLWLDLQIMALTLLRGWTGRNVY